MKKIEANQYVLLPWLTVHPEQSVQTDELSKSGVFYLLTEAEYEAGCKRGRERKAEIAQLKSQVSRLRGELAAVDGMSRSIFERTGRALS